MPKMTRKSERALGKSKATESPAQSPAASAASPAPRSYTPCNPSDYRRPLGSYGWDLARLTQSEEDWALLIKAFDNAEDPKARKLHGNKLRQLSAAGHIIETDMGAPAAVPCKWCSRSASTVECRVWADGRGEACALCKAQSKSGCNAKLFAVKQEDSLPAAAAAATAAAPAATPAAEDEDEDMSEQAFVGEDSPDWGRFVEYEGRGVMREDAGSANPVESTVGRAASEGAVLVVPGGETPLEQRLRRIEISCGVVADLENRVADLEETGRRDRAERDEWQRRFIEMRDTRYLGEYRGRSWRGENSEFWEHFAQGPQ